MYYIIRNNISQFFCYISNVFQQKQLSLLILQLLHFKCYHHLVRFRLKLVLGMMSFFFDTRDETGFLFTASILRTMKWAVCVVSFFITKSYILARWAFLVISNINEILLFQTERSIVIKGWNCFLIYDSLFLDICICCLS